MDFSRRGPLMPIEKTMISQSLQIYVLESIARLVQDMPGRMMFHGGTAISTVHRSPRWSEDLDFMITPDMSDALDDMHELIEKQVRDRMVDRTPGCQFELIDKGKRRGKVRDADPGTVMSWTGRWEHPMRIGVVKMKVEFYIAEPESAVRYNTVMSKPEAIGLLSTHALPTATLETIWADKIMAMSARPVMKWRDIYDMGYIVDTMENFNTDMLFERLKVSCASYRSDLSAIHAGLARDYLVNLPEHYETFKEDTRAWLSPSDFNSACERGTLEHYLDNCVLQIDTAREMIEQRVPGVAEINNDADYSCGF